MGATWKYWTHVRLEMSGKLKRHEILTLKAFFQLRVGEIDELTDSLIQARLSELRASDTSDAVQAAACLRCYVSHQIVAVCADLSQKFQLQRYFTQTELLAYVLDDANPLQPATPYQPLAVKITQSFQASQSSLAYWTKRLVLQHKDLHQALANSGIYLASDWAILNHTKPLHLQQRLAGQLGPVQLEQTTLLLASFHAVYRQDRLRLASAGQRCAEPTLEQLTRMVQHLAAAGLPNGQPQQTLQNLRELAASLRQPQRPTVRLDETLATPCPQPDEQEEFLAHYQLQGRRCLKQAIRLTLDARLTALQQTNPPKAAIFMQALTLFFLDQMPMAQIAPLVGLQKQFQVTRLLNLNGLRAEVRQQWLILIRQELPQLLQHYLESEQLLQLQQLDSLLEASIDRIISEDRAGCYSARRER